MSVENQSISDVDSLSQYIKTIKTNLFDRIFRKQPSTATLNACLAYDIFFLTSFNNKKAAQQVCEFVTPHISKRYKNYPTILTDVLFSKIEIPNELITVEYLITCWRKNVVFLSKPLKRVAIIGTMKAGKSTLINAIIGKKDICQAESEVKTSDIKYIYNKPFEDNITYIWDDNFLSDLRVKQTEEAQEQETEPVYTAVHFAMTAEAERLCIIDTPGVTSSRHKEHAKTTWQFLDNQNIDIAVFVLNGRILKEDTEKIALIKFLNTAGNTKKIFIMNQIDSFDNDRDNIINSRKSIIKYLEELGFSTPVVIPASSKLALLTKRKALGYTLTEYEEDDFSYLADKYTDYIFKLQNLFPNIVEENICDKFIKYKELVKQSGFYTFENKLK